MPIAREGSADEDLLEDSSNRIEEYLHAQGYRDATAPHQRAERPTASCVITFTVERGRGTAWPRSTLSGNAARPARRCSRRGCACGAGQPFAAAALDADVSAIEELYRRRGFASAEVDAAVEPASPAAPADAGRGPWSSASSSSKASGRSSTSVRVEGNTAVPEADAARRRSGSRPGRRSSRRSWRSIATRSSCAVRQPRLPNATVESTPGLSAPTARSADVVFTVREGPQIFVDHVLHRRQRAHARGDDRARAAAQGGRPAGSGRRHREPAPAGRARLFRRTRITELAHGDETPARPARHGRGSAGPTTVGYGGGLEVGPAIRQTDGGGGSRAARVRAARVLRDRPPQSVRQEPIGQPVHAHQSPVAERLHRRWLHRVPRARHVPRAARLRHRGRRVPAPAWSSSRTARASTSRGAAFSAEMVAAASRAPSASAAAIRSQRTELFDEQINPADQLLIDRLFPQVRLSSFCVVGHPRHARRSAESVGRPLPERQRAAGGPGDRFRSRLRQVVTSPRRCSGHRCSATHRLGRSPGARGSGMATGFAREQAGVAIAGERALLRRRRHHRPRLRARSARHARDGRSTPTDFRSAATASSSSTPSCAFRSCGPRRRRLRRHRQRVPQNDRHRPGTAAERGRLRHPLQSPVGPIRVDLGFKLDRQEITPGRLEPLTALAHQPGAGLLNHEISDCRFQISDWRGAGRVPCCPRRLAAPKSSTACSPSSPAS